MDKSLEQNTDYKNKIILFLKRNKFITLSFLLLVFAFSITTIFISENNKNKKIILSEEYIKANFLLENGENDKAKNTLEKIILSNHKFYSLLAFNKLLEKNLIKDKKKILEYFSELEQINLPKNSSDLIQFKKALYLIKIQEIDKGKKILNSLIDNNSNFRLAAEDIIK